MTATHEATKDSDGAALITGASRGIGAAIARGLAAEGFAVVVAARGMEGAEQVAASIREAGGRAQALGLDVTDPHAVAAALGPLREFAASVGGLRLLVNNAGLARSAPLERSGAFGENEDLYRLHMELNFHAPVRLAEALLEDLAGPSGCIVNVASSAGLQGYSYVAAYCASKHALVGWTRAAATERGSRGPRVHAVCPHYVDSPMLQSSIDNVVEKTGKSQEQARAFFAGQNPGGRLVQPEAVAAAVAELASGQRSEVILELTGSEPAP